jgi:hypothetical protein
MQIGDKVRTIESYKYIKWRLMNNKVNLIINGTIIHIEHQGNIGYPYLATVKEYDGTIHTLNLAHLESIKEDNV